MVHGLKRLVPAAALGLCCAAAASAEPGFKHYVVGNPADVTTATTPLLVMQGGGTDVDYNFVRMGAASGGGDFVVIRASGTDAYNPYILGLCACDSVETFVFKNHNGAYQPFVIEHIKNAEALFIAGGDQSDYVNFWKNTPVEDAINFVASKPAPIGGTSAGMAIRSFGLKSLIVLTSAWLVTSTSGSVVTPAMPLICCGVPLAFSQAMSMAWTP